MGAVCLGMTHGPAYTTVPPPVYGRALTRWLLEPRWSAVTPLSALLALVSVGVAVVSALVDDWPLVALGAIVAGFVVLADFRSLSAYRVGWWRGRTATLASLADASERRIRLDEWLAHELDGERSS